MILVEKLKNWNFESSKNHFFENLAWLIDNFCVELFWLLIIESGILKGKFMHELVIDIPLENVKDEKLFEYKSFYIKKQYDTYNSHISNKFRLNIQKALPLHSKSNKTAKQVVIKNIGNLKLEHLKNAIAYTIKHSLDGFAINHLNEQVTMNEVLQDWQDDFSKNKNTNEGWHLVFSLKEIKSPEVMDILKNSVRDTLLANIPEYKWIMIPHSHQNNPHIHIVINKTNIFTKKKMSFKGKSIVDFFERLREDFAHNVYIHSRGKLDYVNEPCNKEFRVKNINNKIELLQSFDSRSNTFENLSNITNLVGDSYRKAINSTSANHRKVFLQIEQQKNVIKNKSIYLYNITKKIKQIESSGKNPNLLKAKKESLFQELKTLKQSLKSLQSRYKEIDKSLRNFVNWEDTFNEYAKNFNDYNKKKALLHSFIGYERYIGSEMTNRLNEIRNEVKNTDFLVKNGLESFLQSFNLAMSVESKSLNSYTISKRIHKILRYKSIVDSINFDSTPQINNKKQAIDDLNETLQNLKILLYQRFLFLQNSLNEMNPQLKALESKYKDFTESLLDNSNDLNEYRRYLHILKKHTFLNKEFYACQKILDKYDIPIASGGVTHTEVKDLAKTEAKIQSKTQEISQESKEQIKKEFLPNQSQIQEQKPQSITNTNNPHIPKR